MSNSTTLEWPKADVDALFRAMEMGRKYLNYDNAKALKAAAGALVRSLGTSTRVAPKFRKIRELEGPVSKWHAQHGMAQFEVSGWFGKPRREETRVFGAKSLANVKKDTGRGKIGRSGLAKQTWTADPNATSGLHGALISRGIDQATKNVAKKYVQVNKQYTGDDPYFEFKNSLPYIEESMVGGKNAVNTAMARAARGLEKSIEKQLVKRMGLGALSR